MEQIKSKAYMLYDNEGVWLGQVVITEDGMFAAVTDYGNFSYTWRSFGKGDFRDFLQSLNTGYFATKMAQGLAYIVHSKKVDKACETFAAKILPALQSALFHDATKWH